jgi:AcrR family transcriptional regulator
MSTRVSAYPGAVVTPGRNELRKAATRERIILAANGLFQSRGYAATSMEDISSAADVAIRTIYLHFDSKAAVLLAYHDAWMAEFVRLISEREPGEGVDLVVRRALDALAAGNYDNDRSTDEVRVLPPVLEFIGAGSPEIAGHLLQRWVAAQDELTVRFRELSGAPADSPVPRLEATAVFAAWMTAILDFRERWANGLPSAGGHEIGARSISAFVHGISTAR